MRAGRADLDIMIRGLDRGVPEQEALVATFLLPRDPIDSLDAYLATDFGALGIGRAQELGPEATIDEVARSGLRGRRGGSAEHIDLGRFPRPRVLTTPKLVDLASRTATYDGTYSRKRPDWTFEAEPQV